MPIGQLGQYSQAVEAFRRRAGMPASSSGIPGGAPVANQQSTANPLATAGQAPIQPLQSMDKPGIDQLNKSQPGQDDVIVKALINRLNQFPPFKPQTQSQPQSKTNARP